MRNQYIVYYVEGEDEEKLLNILKSELRVIKSGKIQKLNVVERKIPATHLFSLRPGTMVVLVFDTDTGKVNILKDNIERLRKFPAVSKVITIPQVRNLEDELIKSCDIRRIRELLGSRTDTEFKSDIIRAKQLGRKLREHRFNIELFWNSVPDSPYENIENLANSIKIK